jgi:DNA-binding transcriptional ArsR family regulator
MRPTLSTGVCAGPWVVAPLYALTGIFWIWNVRGMATTFEVLAEPTRRQILDLLREGERPVGQLVLELRLTQPTVSKHLKALKDAGLVQVRPDAQRRWYRLRVEPLIELDAWLAPYRRFWDEHLDDLERHLDAMPDDPKETP